MSPKRALGTFVVLLPLVLAACGRPTVAPVPASRPGIVLLSAPDGLGALLPEPHVRYPAGTRLVVAALEAETPPRPLDLNLHAAGGAVPTLDGERILFIGQQHPTEPYAIWSCRPDGGDLHRVVDETADCGSVAPLPDGRIVYARAVSGRVPVTGMRSAWALFVKEDGDRVGRRITFSSGCDVDPWVFADGRIVYASWQPDAGMVLWAVHPDGTGAIRVPGAHGGTPFAAQPRQGRDGTLLYRRAGPTRVGGVFAVDWRAPGAADALRETDLATWRRAAQVTPRRRPQGHLSSLRDDVAYGTLFALDARGPTAGARAIRFSALAADVLGAEVLGEVPLAEDGSFHVRLPVDVPLVLETLDADGGVLGRQTTPFWLRPNEVRACVGCHDDPETAPPNRRPRAVLADPVSLLPEGPPEEDDG